MHPSIRGFTLIELSIVLVIIGLLAGGVLVGRDLIRAAEIRKQITQLEQFNTATMTFKTKYHCLPGDCKNAASYFNGVTSGNGDNCITACGGQLGGAVSIYDLSDIYSREAPFFWQHLAAAKMVSGNYDGAVMVTDTTVGGTFPRSILNENVGIIIYSSQNNFNVYSTIEANLANGLRPSVYENTMAPEVIYQLDAKLDDAFPGSGRVNATSRIAFDFFESDLDISTAPALPLTPGTYCVYVPAGGARWMYNIPDGDAPCAVRFRAPF